jgi:cytochrome c
VNSWGAVFASALNDAAAEDDVAAMRNSAGIVKLLLQNGAKPDATASGSTPLQVAADSGCFECVKSLVEAGADINLLTSTGSPAIHLAKRNGHQNIVTELRSHGAKKPTLPSIAASLKAAVPKAGQEMFRQKCGSCHRSVTEPSKGSAPPLWGAIGRNKGSLEGFEYSAAMK